MKGAGDTQEAMVKTAAEGLLPMLEKAKKINTITILNEAEFLELIGQ